MAKAATKTTKAKAPTLAELVSEIECGLGEKASQQEISDGLRALPRIREALEVVEAELVATARRRSYYTFKWDHLASLLGTSKSAIHRKHGASDPQYNRWR